MQKNIYDILFLGFQAFVWNWIFSGEKRRKYISYVICIFNNLTFCKVTWISLDTFTWKRFIFSKLESKFGFFYKSKIYKRYPDDWKPTFVVKMYANLVLKKISLNPKISRKIRKSWKPEKLHFYHYFDYFNTNRYKINVFWKEK